MAGSPFTKWEDAVRTTGVLTVHVGKTASGWSAAISTGMMRFNDLSNSLSFGVKLKGVSDDAQASANVLIEAADGTYTFDQGGAAPGTGTLPPDGNKGVTEFKASTAGLRRAYIFLPLRSKHKEFMKLCMVVHEFGHATGVHEHSDLVKPDIMAATLLPRGDKVEAGVFNSRVMPPIWMSNETGKKIKDCWS